ncbi:alpha/beta fold hydrolase [Brevibacillus choshinensis]|uniref:Alpha/beta hydrolase n=1 Tax=Brevibacillus choshinensis TaxID=54911 RepID=A0ABX7FMA0_BRECH|nr:alpha/beta hydrolase [Brevibacillus choshinensis]QRG67384.1 alpha/beta hydrolase [Brevibacillus choshinensis]
MKEGAALLWLPGWGMPNELFDPVRRCFPSCHHVIPDFTGVTEPGDFMDALIDHRGRISDRRVIVIGWSMGGMLAQRLAAHFPVSGLVLISTTGRFVRSKDMRSKGWPDNYVTRMERGLAENRERVMAAFYQSVLTERERRENRSLFDSHAQNGWTQAALQAGLAYLREEDCRPFSSTLSCPSTIIHGKDDTVCPIAAGEELAASIHRAMFIPIDDCGHAPLLFHPDVVCQAIQRMVEARE